MAMGEKNNNSSSKITIISKKTKIYIYIKNNKKKRRSMKKKQSLNLNTFSFMESSLSSPPQLTGPGPQDTEGAQPHLPAGRAGQGSDPSCPVSLLTPQVLSQSSSC